MERQEQGYSKLDFEQGIEEISIEARKRFYTYAVVSYANIEEIKPLLASAKEWAYVLHDKDVDSNNNPRATHYHILLAYEQNQTYRKLLKLVNSNQNTFIQGLKRCVGNILDYFTHSTEASKEKHQYNEEDVIYSDEQYWKNRLGWKTSEEKASIADNETLVDDLLADDFDNVKMARKYGRDFIKNIKSYNDFRVTYKNNDLSQLERECREITQIKNLKDQLRFNHTEIDKLHHELFELRDVNRQLASRVETLKEAYAEAMDTIRKMSTGEIN